MSSEMLIKSLETIINKNLDHIDLPLRKGKDIYIKGYSVSELDTGLFKVSGPGKKKIAVTEFKVSAIAIARNCALKRNNTREILALDKELAKHYNDALFYKNAIKHAKTVDTLEIKSVRLEQSIAKSKKVRSSLNYFIFRH